MNYYDGRDYYSQQGMRIQTDGFGDDTIADCRSISPNGALPIIPPPEYIQEGSELLPMKPPASTHTPTSLFPVVSQASSARSNLLANNFYASRTSSPSHPTTPPHANNNSKPQHQQQQQQQQQSRSISPQRRSDSTRKKEILLPSSGAAASVSFAEKDVNNNSNSSSNRYLLDDDEFAFMAHVILQQLERFSETYDDQSCANLTVENLLYLLTGERESVRRGVTFTEREIEEFQVALKQRMKYLPYRPRPKEDPLTRLTRDVAQAVARWGFPKPRAEKTRTNIHQPVEERDDETPKVRQYHHSEPILSTPEIDTTTPDLSSNVVGVVESNSKPTPDTKAEMATHHPPVSSADVGIRIAEHDIISADNRRSHHEFPIAPPSPDIWPAAAHQFVPPRVFEIDAVSESFAPDPKCYEVVEDYGVSVPPSIDRNTNTQSNTRLSLGDQPDRSFENKTVVVRETFLWSPPRRPPSLGSHQTIETDKSEIQPQTPRTKQRVKDEIHRVTTMLNLTTNVDVRKSCLDRLAFLRSEFYQAQEAAVDRISPRPPQVVEPKISTPPKQHVPDTLVEGGPKPSRPRNPSPDRHAGDDRYRVVETRPIPALVVATTDDDIGLQEQGNWKDGLFDCLKYGPIHPTVVNGFFCPIVALGQVMTRLRLNWLGRVGTRKHPKEPFRIALFLSMVVVAVDGIWTYLPRIRILDLTLAVLNGAIFLYFCANIWRARCHVRRRFLIPGNGITTILEDVCTAVCCSCCSIMQLSRQTADFESYNAQLCTSTGLPLNIPLFLPPSPDRSAMSSLTNRFEC